MDLIILEEVFGMGWVTQIFVFGFIALALFMISLCFILAKKPGIGLVFAVLELISASVSSLAWMVALGDSGKTDWFLLGILGYPPIGLIFWSMFVVGIRCVVLNIKIFREQKALAASAEN